MARGDKALARESMDGFLSLNYLMGDFLLHENLDGFSRWLEENDKDRDKVDAEALAIIVKAHLIVCRRLMRLNNDRLFGGF